MLILIDIGEILISKVDIIYFGLGGFKIELLIEFLLIF